MAKITIEELYRGDEYDIMGAVTAKAMMLGVDERTEDGGMQIQMVLVYRTIISMPKQHKNGSLHI